MASRWPSVSPVRGYFHLAQRGPRLFNLRSAFLLEWAGFANSHFLLQDSYFGGYSVLNRRISAKHGGLLLRCSVDHGINFVDPLYQKAALARPKNQWLDGPALIA